MAHGYGPPWMNKELKWFIDHYIEGTVALPKIGDVEIKDGKAVANVKTQTKLVSAQMHYTTDTGKNEKRKWVSVDASLDGDTIIAPLPPEDVQTWFITVVDERPAMVSSVFLFDTK
jgi:hypothetical protein